MKREQINLPTGILIILLGFLAVGAFLGGVTFIIRPDGSIYHMPVELLANSPFKNFMLPGFILLTSFGIFPFLVIYGLIKKPENKFLNKLNLINDYHFSWTFSVYTGIALIIWIDIQTLIFNSVDILHTIYSFLGILIICLALLPQTRKHYKF
jgi:hypothetical protein